MYRHPTNATMYTPSSVPVITQKSFSLGADKCITSDDYAWLESVFADLNESDHDACLSWAAFHADRE